MTLMFLTLLAACGLFNNATPVVEVTPVVVAPDAWKKDYVPGSLVAITPSNFKDVWKTVRHDGRSNSDWVKPNIPMDCPDDFTMAINYMVELGDCFCYRRMTQEQSANPPIEADAWEDGSARHNNTYWVDVASSDCVAISEHPSTDPNDLSTHWWKGVKVPSVYPVNGEDEYNQEVYSQPVCPSVDATIAVGDNDQGSGQ
ncbi:TPA: hypothetical protein DEP96_00900 [Candidatus Uhrbacteria bacterium]|nr:hypothetical protein [Candidatus Uhrbacteria bacterium]